MWKFWSKIKDAFVAWQKGITKSHIDIILLLMGHRIVKKNTTPDEVKSKIKSHKQNTHTKK